MQSPLSSIDVGADADAPVDRTYLDADGAHWHVFEQPFADYDRRTGLSLIFSSDSAVRRVRDYPDTWRMMSDAELAVLSWKS